MRRPLVAGNWKMNGSKTSVQLLTETIKTESYPITQCEIVVLPPYIFLDKVAKILENTPVAWGAQNVAVEKQGAFTGEISAEMLINFGCRYVLVGHSERRSYYHETDDLIAKKSMIAYEAGLQPIICLGESLSQREQNLTETVIGKQLDAVLTLDSAKNLLQNACFAYEPVWAIGTGVTASPVQAQQVHGFIRDRIAQLDNNIANTMRIIYGGSVKASNAATLFAMPDIDGALVGGASLDAHEFLEICRCNN